MRLRRGLVAVLVVGAAWLGGPVPRAARAEAQTGSASAEAQSPAWSGWWWPASTAVGPTLFALDGPLDTYDRYVAALTGTSPDTRAWERQELNFPGSAWAGHCNGFAAAALLEPEPTQPVTALGVTFSVADLKGLLVDYHFGDAATWSYGQDGDDGGLNPADLHRMLVNWMQNTRKGFVLTYDLGDGQVWSYPVYRFESQWTVDPDDADVWHVSTTVWMADMDVAPSFVGTKPYPGPDGKTFEYTLRGDPLQPSDGAWAGASRSGRFAHPAEIWYPSPLLRNATGALVSPGLDHQILADIVAGSDAPAGVSTPLALLARPRP